MIIDGLISALIFAVIFAVGYWIYGTIKAMKDPDVKEASELMMNIKHYHIYKKIYEEQLKCYDDNIPVPDRTNEIPDMNEWKRYCNLQMKKSSDEWKKDLDFLRNM